MELKTLSSFLFSKKGGAGLGLEFDYFYKRDLESKRTIKYRIEISVL